MEKVYEQATYLATINKQTVGEYNEYYVTLQQLMTLLEKYGNS